LRPTENIEKLTTRLRASPDEEAQAAVAILFRPNDDDIELLLVKRAEATGDPWSGDMAFPGGKKMPEDSGLNETVAREVLEETGIDLRSIDAVGYMEPLFSSVRKSMRVQPILYSFRERPEVHLNDELTKHVWAPLRALRASRSHAMVKGLDCPVFQVDGEVVWGLTYRMLDKILEMLGD
jgi:8-oxo-dGTP pyrophosphatase MutT (NUDIX family)